MMNFLVKYYLRRKDMRNSKSVLKKALIAVLVCFIIFSEKSIIAEADTVEAYSDKVIEKSDATVQNVDLNEIMSALEGRTISNGDTIIVNGKYRIVCKVTVTKDTNSAGISANTYSQNYTGVLHANITFILGLIEVAQITHNVNITFYDSGLVHINSGSLSVNTCIANWTGYAFNYQIVNTDGTYSTSGGIAELHDTAGGGYYDYSCWATINSGGTPMFTFNQIPR
jgi:hypothetical protein